MQIYVFKEMKPERYDEMKHRSSHNILNDDVFDEVKVIADEVIKNGDQAVIDNTLKFDNVRLTLDSLLVSEKEFEQAWAQTPAEIKSAIQVAIDNAAKYNNCIKPPEMETYTIAGGILAGRKCPR